MTKYVKAEYIENKNGARVETHVMVNTKTELLICIISLIECYIDTGGSFKGVADGYAKYKGYTSGLNFNVNTEE